MKPVTSGDVVFDGHHVGQEPRTVKHLIGVQLQASSFFDGLNLKELVDTFASFYGRKVDAMNLLRQVQLEDKSKSMVKALSRR
ncbi:MAG: hypothetical protein HY092_02010 [Candidatus Kerfeldbacteria bacterium]|nr:hypothetical protein [Candidatus Kerfeldbacteria bacterium]